MNVKRIVVDELPESCMGCEFCVQKVHNPYPVCSAGLYEFIIDTESCRGNSYIGIKDLL